MEKKNTITLSIYFKRGIAEKMNKFVIFSIKDFFSKCDLVTFTEEILYEKLHLCAMRILKN